MSLIIAGERSGVGKTTVTLSILAFLAQKTQQTVQGFKVGPDYIDPMFHTAITGRYCRNLDPILTSPNYVRSCFNLYSSQADYAVIEGVMGLFDGVNFNSEANYASTAHIARLLNIPVLLVLDCSGLSGSIAAIAQGFRILDPKITIAGVILNRVASDRHLELLSEALESINLPILGVMRRHPDIAIPDRHLGLIPTQELPQLAQIFKKLAHIAHASFKWDKLLPLLSAKSSQQTTTLEPTKLTDRPLKIAVARDRAFNFYYQDNLDILTRLGATICDWSPLTAAQIPSDVAGFYFGGGFPEVFAEELAANWTVKKQLQQLIKQNIPVYAECGGLMYLCDRVIDLQQKSWQMVGVIPATATMTSRLTLGYRQTLSINKNSLMATFLNANSIWGHEFHRSKLTQISSQPLWKLRGCGLNRATVAEGWQIYQTHASYLHLHFGESTFLLKKWLNYCRDYKNQLL